MDTKNLSITPNSCFISTARKTLTFGKINEPNTKVINENQVKPTGQAINKEK